MNIRRDGEKEIAVPDFVIWEDANAFSLDRRNFDVLDDRTASNWRAEFRKSKRRRRPTPLRLVIEILNSCNLDCPMCRVGQYGIDLKRHMTIEAFCTVLDQCGSVETVRLNGLGESTLVPNFDEYIVELRRREIEIELITNGTADVATYESILHGNGRIYFSWDSADPEQFEKLRRPASWKQCLRALQRACSCKEDLKRGRVGLLFTLQKSNITEFSNVVQLAADMGADDVQLNILKGGSPTWIDANFAEISEQILHAIEVGSARRVAVLVPDQINGHIIGGNVQVTSGTHCSAPTIEAVVRWNGDLQICNMFNPYILGNVYRDGFKSAWESMFADLFLKKLNSPSRHPYCKNCAYMPKAYE